MASTRTSSDGIKDAMALSPAARGATLVASWIVALGVTIAVASCDRASEPRSCGYAASANVTPVERACGSYYECLGGFACVSPAGEAGLSGLCEENLEMQSSPECVDALVAALDCYSGRYDCVDGGPRGLVEPAGLCGHPDDPCTALWHEARDLGCRVARLTEAPADLTESPSYYFPICLWEAPG